MGKVFTEIDNTVFFQNNRKEKSRGTVVHATRTSLVFEIYNPCSIVQASEVLETVQVMRGEKEIYSGRAVVSNIVQTGLMDIVTVSLLDLWNDLLAPSLGVELLRETQRFVSEWEDGNKIDDSYRLCISNMRSFFGGLNQWLGQLEAIMGTDELEQRPSFQREFCEEIEAPLLPKIEELSAQYEEQGKKIPPENIESHKSFAKRELHHYILRSPFCNRCYTKPLGYAGDYEMVNMILRDRWEGPNTYAKIVNSLLIRSGTAEAHRNRISILVENLHNEAKAAMERGERLKVLNVGCGPCAEIERFILTDELAQQCDFTLIDFNEETIAYAKRRLDSARAKKGLETDQDTFIHQSIHELLKQTSNRSDPMPEAYHLVYCAGLFDYINDRVCARLVKLFYEQCLPGGKVLTTNVHTKHPVKIFLEHLLDWYLILRDEDNMLNLAPDNTHAEVTSDATGVNVFLHVRKPPFR